MDKRDYAIIGLLLVIIAILSYGVINAYNDSQPEVFEFSDYLVTAPAGTHYHGLDKEISFYLHENEAMPFFSVLKNDSYNINDFDIIYNSLKNGSVSKSDMINLFSGFGDDVAILDVNVGDFKGEPEMSILIQNPNNSSQKYLAHLIKHNNDKVFIVIAEMDNEDAKQTYNSLILK